MSGHETEHNRRRKEARELVSLVMPLIEQVLVKQMTAVIEEMREEVLRLRKCCTQRGARMQIMRELFREIDWHHACQDRPEMREWFDEDGVPK